MYWERQTDKRRKILETNDRGALLELDKEGAGILIPEFLSRKERYFIFKVKVLEEHSVSMNLLIYGEDPAEPVMNIRLVFCRSWKHRCALTAHGLKATFCSRKTWRAI